MFTASFCCFRKLSPIHLLLLMGFPGLTLAKEWSVRKFLLSQQSCETCVYQMTCKLIQAEENKQKTLGPVVQLLAQSECRVKCLDPVL